MTRAVARATDQLDDALPAYLAGVLRLPEVLARLGYTQLREGGQKEVVHAVMMSRDVVGILPTAAGKTATYVIPTLCMNWRTIVISPLLALMADQEANMQAMGVAAARVTSDVDPVSAQAALNDWACGNLQIMLVSPERVSNPAFREAVMGNPPDLVALDEAHTFSQWADTFRPGFKFAGDFVREVNPRVVLALTATCPAKMEEEIRVGMSIQKAIRVFSDKQRTNLKLHTLDLSSPVHFAPWVAQNCPGSTIVYCATRSNVEDICADLQRYVGHDREVVFYHGGITSPSVKKDAQTRWTASNDAIMVATNAFGMGIDKALPLDAPVLTPTGWVRNGDLAVGDQVIGRNGKPTTVTHVHERGEVASYLVKFDDGNVVKCSGDHVWDLRTPKENYRGKGFTQRTTASIFGHVKDTTGNNLWFLPVMEPADFNGNVDLPLHPYLLGLLLGGGCISSDDSVNFHKDDPFILAKIGELMPEGGRVNSRGRCDHGLVYGKGRKNPVLEVLRSLQLSGTKAQCKFVPDAYLWTTVENRLSLLRGLMDTDGEASGGGGCGAVFCTASPMLRDAVVFLAGSLGGTPSWRKLNNGDYWQVCLMLPNSCNPFLTPVKHDKVKRHTKHKEPTRCVVDVVEDEPTVMRCITVEADDGLYVTEGFVVTHNSGVRNVVHFDLPGDVGAYTQEAGRAGRDGEDSNCWLYKNPKSISTQKYFIRIGNPTEEDIRGALRVMKTMQDMNGVIHAPRHLIAERAMIDRDLMGAVMTFMYGERLVEEVKDSGKPARIKWADAIPSFTPVEVQTRDAIDDVSREVDGWLEFHIEQLAQQLNLKVETVGARLNSIAKKGLITYVRADTRKPIRICGDPDQVDFSRINEKAAEAMSKLEAMIDFCDVPDEDKHDYLTNYMTRKV